MIRGTYTGSRSTPPTYTDHRSQLQHLITASTPGQLVLKKTMIKLLFFLSYGITNSAVCMWQFSFIGKQFFGDDGDHEEVGDQDEDGVEEEVHKWALLVSYTPNHQHFPPPIIFSKRLFSFFNHRLAPWNQQSVLNQFMFNDVWFHLAVVESIFHQFEFNNI